VTQWLTKARTPKLRISSSCAWARPGLATANSPWARPCPEPFYHTRWWGISCSRTTWLATTNRRKIASGTGWRGNLLPLFSLLLQFVSTSSFQSPNESGKLARKLACAWKHPQPFIIGASNGVICMVPAWPGLHAHGGCVGAARVRLERPTRHIAACRLALHALIRWQADESLILKFGIIRIVLDSFSVASY
jgi:hypothetical protein